MSKYFRLHVPKIQTGEYTFDGDYDLVFDRNNLNSIVIRSDGAAYVKVNGNDPAFVYKDEANRLLEWLQNLGETNNEKLTKYQKDHSPKIEYVGTKIGKCHEDKEISEYYCGRCGYPVSDHDSFCKECGGAFQKSFVEEKTCKWVWIEEFENTPDSHECIYCNWNLSCGCFDVDSDFLYYDDPKHKPDNNWKFCPRCGARITNSETKQSF